MTKRPRAVHEAQLISEVAELSGLTVLNVRKAFEAYDIVIKERFMTGKKIPLPAAMGYVYATVTRMEPSELESTLTDKPVNLQPRLRAIATFSKPWKKFINEDPRAADLIQRIIADKKKITLKKKNPPLISEE